MEQGKISRPEATKLKFTIGDKDHVLKDDWFNEVEPFVVKNRIIL
jgi:hypothetical protein